MIGIINPTAQVWSQWMFDMFWQVSLLIILVIFFEMVTRRRAWPHVRYVLWGLVFLKLLIPPTWQMPTGIVSLIQPTVSEHMPVQFENTPWFEESPSTSGINESSRNQLAESTPVEKATWPTILFLIWIAGVLFFVLLLAIQMSRLPKRSQKRYERDAPEWFDTVLGSISARLHLKKAPSVIFSRNAGSPAVYGLFRPVLVLPKGYFKHLDRKQAEHVLLHELCHIKRGDLWVHWFCILIQIVYWFNPFLILARRQFGHVSEICCDLTVADVLREKTSDYRETLLSTSRMFLADATKPGIGLLGIFEEPFRILTRLKWLKQKTWEHRKRKIIVTLVTTLFMVICVMPMAVRSQSAKGNTASKKIPVQNEGAPYNLEKLTDEALKNAEPILSESQPVNFPKRVAVLISKEIMQYMQAVDALSRDLEQVGGYQISRIVLESSAGNDLDDFWKALEQREYDLVVTVGPYASRFMAIEHRETAVPVVYTMLLNPEKSMGQDSPACGVSLNIPVASQLGDIREKMPWVHTIGVLYDPAGNSLFIQEATTRAKEIGLQVVGIPVDGKGAIQSELEKNWYQMDALWLIPDKTVISSADMVPYLINEALLRKVPVIGYNRFFFDSGAALAYNLDYDRIGRQTAEIVSDRLGKNLCRNEAPEYEILVNDRIFNQIGALSANN